MGEGSDTENSASGSDNETKSESSSNNSGSESGSGSSSSGSGSESGAEQENVENGSGNEEFKIEDSQDTNFSNPSSPNTSPDSKPKRFSDSSKELEKSPDDYAIRRSARPKKKNHKDCKIKIVRKVRKTMNGSTTTQVLQNQIMNCVKSPHLAKGWGRGHVQL